MKKLLLFLLLIPLLLPAQDFYWHRTTMGIALSPEVTSIMQHRFEDGFSFTQGGPGFSIGPRLQFPLSRHFFFRTGVSLAQRNFTTNNGFPPFFGPDIILIDEPGIIIGPPINSSFFPPQRNNVQLTFTDFSFELGYMLPGKVINWYFTAGPRYHLRIAERREIRPPSPSVFDTPEIIRSSKVDFENSNLSLQLSGGMAVKLSRSLQFFAETGIFYNLGSAPIGEFAFERYKALSISTGLNFALF